MDSCGNEEGRQRREHQPLPVLRELVVAAMEAKVQRDGPIAAGLRMEDVPTPTADLLEVQIPICYRHLSNSSDQLHSSADSQVGGLLLCCLYRAKPINLV